MQKMMNQTASFSSAFEMLNQQQKRAVTAIEGPVMVIAGPGTGKTHVLACRIAHILATQEIEPRNILALTFTDAAAKNMRERIVQMIGSAGYHVAIATFHSFCSEVISEHPEYFDLARESIPLSDLERFSIFEELLENTQLDVLKPMSRTLYYLREIQSSISDLKREGVSPDAFEAILTSETEVLETDREELKKTELKKREKNLAKQKELHTLYVKYQAALLNNNRFDFDDMVSMVADAFTRHTDLLAEYQEKLQYVLVDEYQDTNASQNAVVDALVSFWGEQANIFVVGDPHQSIFRFQGASVENMLGFLERYPAAQVITLETGYRCPQTLYDAAHVSISHNSFVVDSKTALAPNQDATLQKALSTRLISPKSSGEEQALRWYEAPNQVLEEQFVVEQIKELLQEGVNPSQIAVLYKNHSDVAELSAQLLAEDVPFETDNSGNIFDDVYITQLIQVIQTINDITAIEDSGAFFEVLLYEWLELPRLAVLQTARIASKKRASFIDVLEMDIDVLSAEFMLDIDGFVALQGFKDKLELLRARAANMQFHAWFELLISDEGLGFYSWLVKHADKKEQLLTLNSLFTEVKKWIAKSRDFNIQDFLFAVITMIEHGIIIKTQALKTTTDRVTLCSVHKAKGQEWDYVFVLALRDKKWGNTRKRNLLPLPQGILKHVDSTKQQDDEEDRRLFYVALTRAKLKTFLSYAASEIDGKAVRTFIKSMFVSEVSDQLTSFPETFTEKLSTVVEQKINTPMVSSARPIGDSEKDFYASLVADFVLSVTALNTYLKDPKEFVFNSLLRVPRAKAPHMSYGTAMHAALEKYYKDVDATKGVSKITVLDLQQIFTEHLKKESLPDVDFDVWKGRGLEALDAYHSQHSSNLAKPLFTERFFGGTFGKAVLMDGSSQIFLSGRLDRIDILDSVRKTVRLVDYKTGKSKSENEIEAATQVALKNLSEREQTLPESIRGAYKRQLVFYVLLAQLDTSFPYTVQDTVFEFVEPTESGKIVERHFVISQSEVEELKSLIITVMREIRELAFLTDLS
ncbi:MAG: ATP-dependent helicase [Candidatus Pacebacteria bacterium]|nr:ATP-dependent helicase [Candidatus Paceibacterota bacterium]PIR63179.1 MAG: hypothetical protein COU64_05685 [Candidatus Pacebacteria bacterium CG10_big_fil_rev_8_21_14_0_10_40_26]PIZ78209.1 MAG: hypothetical protein COY01_05505 [Candidatus Pacebacteria bacterium CG_4_10_14_0_2_um_filter_40_20]PJA68746.1 MAG: hypothetical protein CO156_04540 [Candidatus Pacebacteria bacterium CG_4_9_14_3_um_filter_40_12]PJC41686.1 MAG: hypothetical protein CO041_03130 [Candidatus Pacebacteria bacterium CG_4_